jgi:hypothetical protein
LASHSTSLIWKTEPSMNSTPPSIGPRLVASRIPAVAVGALEDKLEAIHRSSPSLTQAPRPVSRPSARQEQCCGNPR